MHNSGIDPLTPMMHVISFQCGMNGMQMLMTWFASYVNLVRSRWACALHEHMHGKHAIIKMGTLKYSNALTGMPVDSSLRKLNASHFNVLITQKCT